MIHDCRPIVARKPQLFEEAHGDRATAHHKHFYPPGGSNCGTSGMVKFTRAFCSRCCIEHPCQGCDAHFQLSNHTAQFCNVRLGMYKNDAVIGVENLNANRRR